MVSIKIIAAIGKNNELGINNELIWHLKEDLKFFKEETMGHKIVMGYNTFLSLPKLLPGRTHIVLTHHEIDQQFSLKSVNRLKVGVLTNNNALTR